MKNIENEIWSYIWCLTGSNKMLLGGFCQCFFSLNEELITFIIDFCASSSPSKHDKVIDDSAFGQNVFPANTPT
jgi:hypothetical protein